MYTPPQDSVIEPNLLDLMPVPRDLNAEQREQVIQWYTVCSIDKLTEYMRNTQQRIYREYYADPKKKFVGDKLYNLYAMRDLIHEAMRRRHVSIHPMPSPGKTAITDIQTVPITPNYVPLERLDGLCATRPTWGN